MPYKPMRPCSFPGCPNLTDGKYCEEHKSKAPKDRPSAGKRGYNSRWQKESKKFLDTHPLCVPIPENMVSGNTLPGEVFRVSTDKLI